MGEMRVGRLEVQSYGGGVQSVALAILNATGRVEPPARVAVFCNPGSEEPGTYSHLEVMEPWLKQRGVELVRRAGAARTSKAWAGRDLYSFTVEAGTPIPIRTKTSLGHRKCTRTWKIEVVLAELRARGAGPGRPAVVQLGISWDEVQRMKASTTRWAESRYPLIELRLSRDDCRRIIEDEGLPVPPKSRCFFCPMQPVRSWERRAIEQPELFEAAARLEDAILARQAAQGKPAAYLSSRLRPLRRAFSGAQAIMSLDGGDEEGSCGGFCFT